MSRTQLTEITSMTRLSPPEFLSVAGAREWREIVNSLPAGYFRPSDVPLLAAYCTSSAMHKQAAEMIESEGMVITTAKGVMFSHPANSLMLQHASSMAQLAVKLRLCPSARFTKGEKPQKGVAGGGGERPWSESGTA